MVLRVACRASDVDKHEFDITRMLFLKGKLYTAGDDGRIKIWTEDLVKLADIHAHTCSVYCITASNDTLYSCSSDGTIKMWELETLKPKGTLAEGQLEYWTVRYCDGHLFAGDDEGNVSVFDGKELYGQVNIAEPIKDMIISDNFLLTVRDVSLVITELRMKGEKIQYFSEGNYSGRAPVTLIGDKLFAFISTDGREIQLHENSHSSGFRPISKMTHGSELIINALAGAQYDNETFLYSGGWDKTLKQWSIHQNRLTNENSIDLEMVITGITCGPEKDVVYVGGSDGHIIRVDEFCN